MSVIFPIFWAGKTRIHQTWPRPISSNQPCYHLVLCFNFVALWWQQRAKVSWSLTPKSFDQRATCVRSFSVKSHTLQQPSCHLRSLSGPPCEWWIASTAAICFLDKDSLPMCFNPLYYRGIHQEACIITNEPTSVTSLSLRPSHSDTKTSWLNLA